MGLLMRFGVSYLLCAQCCIQKFRQKKGSKLILGYGKKGGGGGGAKLNSTSERKKNRFE